MEAGDPVTGSATGDLRRDERVHLRPGDRHRPDHDQRGSSPAGRSAHHGVGAEPRPAALPKRVARVQATDTRFDGGDDFRRRRVVPVGDVGRVLPAGDPAPHTPGGAAGHHPQPGDPQDQRGHRRARPSPSSGWDGRRWATPSAGTSRARLAQPPTLGNLVRYADSTLILAEINTNLAEQY